MKTKFYNHRLRIIFVDMKLWIPYRAIVAIGLALFVYSLSACTKQDSVAQSEKKAQLQRDSVAIRDSLHKVDSMRTVRRERSLYRFAEPIKYQRVYVRSISKLDSIKRVFSYPESADSSKVIALLNRKEWRFMRVGDTLILPDKIELDPRAYSIFPQYYQGAEDVPRLVMVSNEYQSYACYQYGELVRFAACNTGTKSKPTFPGLYHVNWRQRERISSLNEEWILPFTINFHRYAGSAFHQFDMPGRPVSHSCIRQFLDDAKWLYSWVRTPRKGEKGTPIIIVGMFDYKRKRGGPWWELTSSKDGSIKLPAEPMKTEDALIPFSQIPKDVRGGLPNKARYLSAQDTLLARGVIDSTFKLRESIDYNKLRAQKKARKAKMQGDSAKPSMNLPPSAEPHG
ncbi:MAG: L,D-transpeptidase [Candidatus Kapaibacterium sp.]|jgi:hypothetical protein